MVRYLLLEEISLFYNSLNELLEYDFSEEEFVKEFGFQKTQFEDVHHNLKRILNSISDKNIYLIQHLLSDYVDDDLTMIIVSIKTLLEDFDSDGQFESRIRAKRKFAQLKIDELTLELNTRKVS